VRTRLQNIGGEDGFTLIELLVVILIIGIIASIAIPSFLNQTGKAYDASAKELAHSAQIAVEDYATDHSGSYTGITAAALPNYDATIQTTSNSGSNAYVVSVTNATGTGYTVTTSPANGAETFSITRLNGQITRTCTPSTGQHGGCTNGTW
jgi:type IV pilus assembly protein PilA